MLLGSRAHILMLNNNRLVIFFQHLVLARKYVQTTTVPEEQCFANTVSFTYNTFCCICENLNDYRAAIDLCRIIYFESDSFLPK